MKDLESLYYLPLDRFSSLVSSESVDLFQKVDNLIKNWNVVSKNPTRVTVTTGIGINDLPNEVLLKIFSYLNCFNLMRVGIACRRFSIISSDDTLWLPFFKYPLCTNSIYLSEKELFERIKKEHKSNVKALFMKIFRREQSFCNQEQFKTINIVSPLRGSCVFGCLSVGSCVTHGF